MLKFNSVNGFSYQDTFFITIHGNKRFVIFLQFSIVFELYSLSHFEDCFSVFISSLHTCPC